MTEHPITPPPELVQQWRDVPEYATGLEKLTMVTLTTAKLQEIATLAAQWGADHELEACCEWLDEGFGDVGNFSATLRTARRPRSLTLKERALEAWEECWGSGSIVQKDSLADTIRRAIEALPE
jgi:hypothetical protein